MRVKLVAPVVLGLFIAVACGGKNDTSQVTGGAASGNGTAASGNGAGGSLVVGNGGSSASDNGLDGGDTTFDPDAACAATSESGEPVPVDLLFMVDITGSMDCPEPEDTTKPACEVKPNGKISSTTRWTVESAALKAFIADPKNAGLGMGIKFFPSGNNLCDAANYVTPTVEIGTLPGAAMSLTAAIDMQSPDGQTPTKASLQGALQHAAAWAKMNPTHRVAVVYSTDGYPMGCNADSIDAAATEAATALAGTPSIPTYALGVGPNLTDLNKIAMAGGTKQAFLIDPSGDAATQLSAALASIRTTAVVGCTYVIPPPPKGQTLDPMKVNVTYTDSTGKVTKVLQDAPNVSCDQGTGWQYSQDGTQINLCGSLCTAVKADKGGSLQVLFGCNTEVGNPPK